MPARPFHTETRTFGELIGNGRAYAVPRFQRDYAWEQDEWADLWEDLVALETAETVEDATHYMGYVVTQAHEKGGRLEWLIDGQQRLSTLSVVVLAGMGLLRKWADAGETPAENREREAELRRRFIGHRELAALTTTPKLTLNRLDEDFWRDHVVRMQPPARGQRLHPSNKRLWRALEFFEKKLATRFAGSERGVELVRFLDDRVGERLVFTVITVDNDLAAYKVFETLNARGVKLSTSDLLKNHLLLVVAREVPSDVDLAERLWIDAARELGASEFPAYLRHFWNSGHPPTRTAQLFREVRTETKDASSALKLLQDLRDHAPLYHALDVPAAALWTRAERPFVEALTFLNTSQFAPAVLAAARQGTNEEGRTKLLRLCLIVSLRHHVSGLSPAPLEEAWSEVARDILKDGFQGVKRLMGLLSGVYRDDEGFAHDFKNYAREAGRSRPLLRWMLCQLEGAQTGTTPDHDEPRLTIEHILPRRSDAADYPDFHEDVRDDFVHRLGNYALMVAAGNRDGADRPFAEKRALYDQSKFAMTRELATLDAWTPRALERRQERMAKLATQLWRIDV